MRTSHLQKESLRQQQRDSRQLCSPAAHVVMQLQLRLPIATASRWCLQGDDTTVVNALHPAQRRFIPRADTERSSITFNASLNIA